MTASAIVYPPVPDVPLEPALERLFWRAGFGPSESDRKRFRTEGLGAAIEHLLDPPRGNVLRGPEPVVDDGEGHVRPLQPESDAYGYTDIVLWWLDRMVRTRAPLVERMTLNLHDHFATSNEDLGQSSLMLRQNALLRRHALGSFAKLAHGMLDDHAMQWWLNLIGSAKEAPNENFARELMELFTLGAGYTEDDIREAARALTGYEFDWSGDDRSDPRKYRWNAKAWDAGVKTVLGRRGKFRPHDIVNLCLGHPRHSPFLVSHLWSYFAPGEVPGDVLSQAVAAYERSGRRLKPVLRVILRSRAFYENLDEPDLVKPPVVFLAGAMRATGTYVRSDAWVWLLANMGQLPFYPPNVGGWDQNESFLSTASNKARWESIAFLLYQHPFADEDVSPTEAPAAALDDSRRFAGEPWTGASTAARLARFARETVPDWDGDTHTAAERRRVLRHLLLAGPDAQVH
ncbi:MAG: DUF1800 family protein [Gaiellales bacterium]